jgi:alpha-1,2-mannosyltransferase
VSQHTSATGLRITDPGPRQPVLRWVVELLPAYLVALAILPWVIAGGVAWPWQPSTIDLQVYVYAVQDMLAGRTSTRPPPPSGTSTSSTHRSPPC